MNVWEKRPRRTKQNECPFDMKRGPLISSKSLHMGCPKKPWWWAWTDERIFFFGAFSKVDVLSVASRKMGSSHQVIRFKSHLLME
ncbi:unnamed protein product [Camellia sinensis]